MALYITEDCTLCEACPPECPNEAITEGDPYVINPELCTECVGAHDEPQCQLVCPSDCVEPDPRHVEDQAALLAKYEALHG